MGPLIFLYVTACLGWVNADLASDNPEFFASHPYEAILSTLKITGPISHAALGLLLPAPVQLANKNFTDDMVYYLYTKENPKNPDILRPNNTESLDVSHFNRSIPTVFITHGYTGHYESDSCTLVRDAYLANYQDLNVIVVDWSKTQVRHLTIPVEHYLFTAYRVPAVGQSLGQNIKFLANKGYLKYEETILTGHSLGAHVMGVAGYTVGGKLQAIFGTDPAKPLFDGTEHEGRLSKEDAKHVQIIHTNMGVWGSEEMTGHIDFIVNNGASQDGCPINVLPCSHARSYEYFAESINAKVGFWGNDCSMTSDVPNCTGATPARMGGLVPYGLGTDHVSKIYHVVTNSTNPFALGLTYTFCHNGFSGPCSDSEDLATLLLAIQLEHENSTFGK